MPHHVDAAGFALYADRDVFISHQEFMRRTREDPSWWIRHRADVGPVDEVWLLRFGESWATRSRMNDVSVAADFWARGDLWIRRFGQRHGMSVVQVVDAAVRASRLDRRVRVDDSLVGWLLEWRHGWDDIVVGRADAGRWRGPGRGIANHAGPVNGETLLQAWAPWALSMRDPWLGVRILHAWRDGCSMQEVADVTGITVSGVSDRLGRIRRNCPEPSRQVLEDQHRVASAIRAATSTSRMREVAGGDLASWTAAAGRVGSAIMDRAVVEVDMLVCAAGNQPPTGADRDGAGVWRAVSGLVEVFCDDGLHLTSQQVVDAVNQDPDVGVDVAGLLRGWPWMRQVAAARILVERAGLPWQGVWIPADRLPASTTSVLGRVTAACR